jgi:hypothetical protein
VEHALCDFERMGMLHFTALKLRVSISEASSCSPYASGLRLSVRSQEVHSENNSQSASLYNKPWFHVMSYYEHLQHFRGYVTFMGYNYHCNPRPSLVQFSYTH